jgi:hypothetical protein
MSCLFNSLSYFIKEKSPDDLRQLICDYLLSNPKIMDTIDVESVTQWESGVSLELYIKNMRNTNVWGGAIEIKAFCEIFNVSVFVKLNTGKHVEFIPNSLNEKTQVIQLYYTGNHYEPIKLTRS